MSRTITTKAHAWLTEFSTVTPEQLTAGSNGLIHSLSFSCFDMAPCGWTLVGEAEISVTLADVDTIVQSKVQALRSQKETVLAEAQARVTRLDAQIQSLLAIEYQAEAA